MAGTPRTTDLDLSPSRVHARLMKGLVPRLRYDGGDVAAWQRKVRRKLRALLRVPKTEKGPLRARTLWTRETDLGRIEKLVFTAEPGADVPAYWCVPRGARPPYRTFICLQGHSTGMHNSIGVAFDDETTPIEVAGDRDFGLGCMRREMAALCVEQRAFGERAERDQAQRCERNTCHDAVVRAQMLGRTLLGERILDVDRAIDYLASRGDVDMGRLGCLGNSGGGTTTMYAAALLPRLKAVIPSCCVATMASSLLTLYHCGCNHAPDLALWADMDDVLGCVAPRPCVVVSGKEDAIFPLAGARAAVRRLKGIYKAAGAADRCRHVVGPEGHRFYADLAWAAMGPMLDRL